MTRKGQAGPLRMLWCVVWLALVLGLEHHGGLFAFGRKLGVLGPEPLEESSTAFAALQYGLLSNAGYRPVQARRVRLISLSSGVEPEAILLNVCPQREFMADLIRALNAFRVSFIAIDKYFGKGACPEGDPGTAALLDAVAQSPVPIVVGRQTDRDQEGELSRSAPELFDVPSLLKAGQVRTHPLQ